MDENVQVPLTRVGCTTTKRVPQAAPAALPPAPPPPSRLLSLLCQPNPPPASRKRAAAAPPQRETGDAITSSSLRGAPTSAPTDWLPCPVCGLRLPRGPAFDKHAAAEAATAAAGARTARRVTDVLPGRGLTAPRPRVVDLSGASASPRRGLARARPRQPRTLTLPALPPRFNHYGELKAGGALCDQSLGIDGASDATGWKVGGVAKLGNPFQENE